MKLTVNLATRPYVDLRPAYLRLRIVMAVCAVLAIAAFIAAHLLNQKLEVAEAQMQRLQRATSAAQQQKAANERRMRQPENAATLERAHFLNGLFLRKSFSWTAVMMDLETVLPTGVQVTSLEPQVAADGNVTIRMRVAGERDRAVLLVRNLERSKRFRAPRLTGETQHTKDQNGNVLVAAAANAGGVEFEVLADYVPLSEGETVAPARQKAGAQ